MVAESPHALWPTVCAGEWEASDAVLARPGGRSVGRDSGEPLCFVDPCAFENQCVRVKPKMEIRRRTKKEDFEYPFIFQMCWVASLA